MISSPEQAGIQRGRSAFNIRWIFERRALTSLVDYRDDAVISGLGHIDWIVVIDIDDGVNGSWQCGWHVRFPLELRFYGGELRLELSFPVPRS